MTTSEPRWMQLLRTEAARTSIGSVAARLDYSRTSISLVLSGKYPGNTERIEAKTIATLESEAALICPYVGERITAIRCRENSTRRAPTHNPTSMNHWSACQRCQNRCKGDV